ncbi:hypothetical protein [Okeania sp. SIO3B5]|nr:hypothetical protein [Okeania sp. SIO3B5]
MLPDTVAGASCSHEPQLFIYIYHYYAELPGVEKKKNSRTLVT